jgi:hypothetical protein
MINACPQPGRSRAAVEAIQISLTPAGLHSAAASAAIARSSRWLRD